MGYIIAGFGLIAIGFIAGLLVGRKHPSLADKVHDEGQKVTQDIKDKLK